MSAGGTFTPHEPRLGGKVIAFLMASVRGVDQAQIARLAA